MERAHVALLLPRALSARGHRNLRGRTARARKAVGEVFHRLCARRPRRRRAHPRAGRGRCTREPCRTRPARGACERARRIPRRVACRGAVDTSQPGRIGPRRAELAGVDGRARAAGTVVDARAWGTRVRRGRRRKRAAARGLCDAARPRVSCGLCAVRHGGAGLHRPRGGCWFRRRSSAGPWTPTARGARRVRSDLRDVRAGTSVGSRGNCRQRRLHVGPAGLASHHTRRELSALMVELELQRLRAQGRVTDFGWLSRVL